MKNQRIYVIGPVGSGKTTFTNILSKKYNIKKYELDSIVWDDSKGIKRSCEEIDKLFKEILKQNSFIIEDVGRDIFKQGIVESDIIYYIKLGKIRSYLRVIKRWIKQKLKWENANYKPTIKMLFKMIKWLHNDLKNRNKKIEEIKKCNNNLIILNYRKLKNYRTKK